VRLLYITASYPYGGTAESFLEPELAALVKLGAEVDVLPVRRNGPLRAMPAGIGLRPETLRDSWHGAARRVGRRDGQREAVELVRLLRASPRAYARNAAVLPLAMSVAAAIAGERGYDHVHAHWLSHTSTCALAISILTGTQFSVTAHRWDVYAENLFALKAQRASFIRFVARTCRAAFEARAGSPAGRLVDLHMGVDVAITDGSPPARRPPRDTLRLVAVGSLLPVKGQRHLVDAIAVLRDRGLDVHLDLFGSGPLGDELRRQVSGLGLGQHVEMQGERPHDELTDAYTRADYDIFVMPSVDLGHGVHEGVPVSIMEAMAAGVPTVATDTGGIPELVVHGVTGLLVPQGSASALADAIEQLGTDVGLRQRLSDAGVRHVRAEFDSATIAGELLALMRG
jgi:glycosyltransferase involved in cell wall biosynthesis